MKTKNLRLTILIITCQQSFAQTYPTFGTEIPVTLSGLTFDAMEPSISDDGNYFFLTALTMELQQVFFMQLK